MAYVWVSQLRLSFVTLAIFVQAVIGSPGEIDTSFGIGGVTELTGTSRMFAITEGLSGKVMVLGQYGSQGNYRIDLRRLNSDGTIDQSFGVNGQAVGTKPLPYFGTPVYAAVTGMAVQSDGKVLVVGILEDSKVSAVWRFTASGILDTTFGTAGRSVIPATSILGSSTNNIVIDGTRSVISYSENKCTVLNNCSWNGYLIRLNQNGSIDTTFGTSGRASVGALGPVIQSPPVARRSSNGSFYAGLHRPTDYLARVKRFTNTGAPDLTFGLLGSVNIPPGCFAFLGGSLSVYSQSDGKLVGMSSGLINFGQPITSCAFRLTVSGSLDAGFGSAGFVTFPSQDPDLFESPTAALLQNDRLVILLGQTTFPDFQRLNLDGSQDATFVPAHPGYGNGVAVSPASNQKVLTLTSLGTSSGFKYFVARFLQN